MKVSILSRMKDFNWVSVVQSCWVMLAVFISMSEIKAEGLSDPTKPPEAVIELMPEITDADIAQWNLQGVKVAGKQSVAIVDGQWIAVGKDYEGFRLIRVTPTQATFSDKTGNKKVLDLLVKPFQTVPKNLKQSKHQHKAKSKNI